MSDDLRAEIERAIEVHQVVWISHEDGWDCGCNERGDLPPMRTLLDALRHQTDALLSIVERRIDQARAKTAEDIAQAVVELPGLPDPDPLYVHGFTVGWRQGRTEALIAVHRAARQHAAEGPFSDTVGNAIWRTAQKVAEEEVSDE